MAVRWLASNALRHRRRCVAPPIASSLRSFSGGADGELFQVPAEMPVEDVFHLDTSNLWPMFRAPVSAVSTFLDSIHATTGAPWWIVLAGSTIAMRAALFPLTVLQLQKTVKLAQLSPQLPSPVPLQGSGISMRDQFKLYSQKRKELGVPSPAWCFTSFFVHLPIFITWIVTIRNMAIKKFPGFDTGGTLWFTDLTVPVSGDFGAVLPLALSVAYIFNIEVSLKGIQPKPGLVGSLISIYTWWLRFCFIPIFVSGFYFPQGVFMYILPNTLFSLTQTLFLRSRPLRKTLGLPVTVAPKASAESPASESEKLVKLAADHVVRKNRDGAIQCLQEAIRKDPENASACFALGKLHADAGEFDEGTDLLTQAASKAKDQRLQVSAYLSLGIAMYKQGKVGDAIDALKIVAGMDEPRDLASRKKYNVALVTLGSLLSQEGQKAVALEYLERAAEYDPKVGELYVAQIKKEMEIARQAEEVEEACVQVDEATPTTQEEKQTKGKETKMGETF